MVTAATFSDRVMLPVQVVLAVSALGLQHSCFSLIERIPGLFLVFRKVNVLLFWQKFKGLSSQQQLLQPVQGM